MFGPRQVENLKSGLVIGGVGLLGLLLVGVVVVDVAEQKPAPPPKYQDGEPGFGPVDRYQYDSDGKRVTDEERQQMKDAVKRFMEAHPEGLGDPDPARRP
jgi:hypothetical protein